MTNPFRVRAMLCGLMTLFVAGRPGAQSTGASPQARPTPVDVALAKPTYVSIVLETTVNRSAGEVWNRVGKYCDLTEWLLVPCTIVSGKDGEVGAVRLVRGTVVEVLVGKTEFSYTYAFPVKAAEPYN